MLTLFTWGYWGCGSRAADAADAFDRVESERGFAQPLLVDVRIRRAGRAPDFREAVVAGALGADRYLWMQDLGNAALGTGDIRIARPEAVADLLGLAMGADLDERRRVIFFCACEAPASCHRAVVARLLVEEARRANIRLRVEEWPGGEPTRATLVSRSALGAARSGSMYLPVAKPTVEQLATPWCSLLELGADQRRLVGPAQPRGEQGWVIPVQLELGPGASVREYEARAAELRTQWGYDAIET